jgi:sugar/nucleoside kinase (ribokinase family)
MPCNEIVAIGELLVEIMRPHAGIPLSETSPFVGPFPSGAPAIFADQAARLGRGVGFIGACGADGFGDCLVGRLQTDGIDCAAVTRVPDVATGCAFVSYDEDGGRRFIFHIANSAAGQLPEPTPEMLVGTRWLHVCGSTLSAGGEMRRRCYRACELAREAGARVSFDPNLRPELLGGEAALRQVCSPVLHCASLVLPSACEAEVLTGVAGADAACAALLAGGAEVVALKRGADGCSIYSPAGRSDIPAFEVAAVDPTGAGDCFDAGFVAGLLEGLSLDQAGRLANACGALGATRLGPMEGAFTLAEVTAFLEASR